MVYISEEDRAKALKSEKPKLPGEAFGERRAQRPTGKTRKKRGKEAIMPRI